MNSSSTPLAPGRSADGASAAWAVSSVPVVAPVASRLTAYENQVLNAPNGTAMPALPPVSPLPTPPAAPIAAGIEARRVL